MCLPGVVSPLGRLPELGPIWCQWFQAMTYNSTVTSLTPFPLVVPAAVQACLHQPVPVAMIPIGQVYQTPLPVSISQRGG